MKFLTAISFALLYSTLCISVSGYLPAPVRNTARLLENKRSLVLPAASGPMEAKTPEKTAILTVYFVQGALGLSALARTFFFKDQLGLSPAESAAITGAGK